MANVPFNGITYQGVVNALQDYADRKDINLADALCHALSALGAAEALSPSGQLLYVPGARLQERLLYWGEETTGVALPFNLGSVGAHIADEVVVLPVTLITTEAATVYNSYRNANSAHADEAQVIAKAVYCLLLIEAGDLSCRHSNGETSVPRME